VMNAAFREAITEERVMGLPFVNLLIESESKKAALLDDAGQNIVF
jgi:hypothetical protein